MGSHNEPFDWAAMEAALEDDDYVDERLQQLSDGLSISLTDALADDTDTDDGNEFSTEGLSPEQIRELQARIRAKLFEPKPYDFKPTKKRIAIVDTETDPFENGLIIKPFTLGFYDGNRYLDFWGDDCVKQFFEFLACEDEEYIIYAHNGGKFDFFFFLDYLDADQSPLIINGRLVKAKFQGQEFRDSYAIIPWALGTYKKDKIDYDLFKPSTRDFNQKMIRDYQKSDCIYLHDLVMGFYNLFGDKLTIASATLPMLHSYHGFAKIKSERIDEVFRNFYYGGRNQCFETGILKPRYGDKWIVIDRNSMYPTEMRDTLHPISASYELQREITDETDFACIEAENDNCLPIRAHDGGLDFTCKRGIFYATIHEIRAGLDTGTLKILRVKHAYKFDRKSNFSDFVNRFYDLRLEAQANEDVIRYLLYKTVLNAAYGKFALNPRKFKQWTFTIDDVPEPIASPANPEGWTLHSQGDRLHIWERPSPRRSGFYNVATAASITGAARANLHRNLALATRPIYCDTDSIICEAFAGELEAKALGGWKLEGVGDIAAIGGKKLYALFNENDPIKKASKGAVLTPDEILRICKGEEITWANPVPNFKLDGSADFVTRKIRKTGGPNEQRQLRFL